MENTQENETKAEETSLVGNDEFVVRQVSEAEALIKLWLEEADGRLGSAAIRKKLSQVPGGSIDQENIPDILERIRLSGSSPDREYKIFHQDRSFMNEKEFYRLQRELDKTAEKAATTAGQQALQEAEEEPDEYTPRKKENRQDEARATQYIKKYLEEIYFVEDKTPADCDCAFDVHASRSGGDYENVDVIAIDWRTSSLQVPPEVVSVKVKLDFTSKLVQQANNYRRLSDRVWIAVLVQVQLEKAAENLKFTEPLLFNYIVSCGLGILAFKRTQGSGCKVQAVHWPSLQSPQKSERQTFFEKQRKTFESAGILEHKKDKTTPKYD